MQLNIELLLLTFQLIIQNRKVFLTKAWKFTNFNNIVTVVIYLKNLGIKEREHTNLFQNV